MIILTSKYFVFNFVGKLVRGFRIVTKTSYEEFGSESRLRKYSHLVKFKVSSKMPQGQPGPDRVEPRVMNYSVRQCTDRSETFSGKSFQYAV